MLLVVSHVLFLKRSQRFLALGDKQLALKHFLWMDAWPWGPTRPKPLAASILYDTTKKGCHLPFWKDAYYFERRKHKVLRHQKQENLTQNKEVVSYDISCGNPPYVWSCPSCSDITKAMGLEPLHKKGFPITNTSLPPLETFECFQTISRQNVSFREKPRVRDSSITPHKYVVPENNFMSITFQNYRDQ